MSLVTENLEKNFMSIKRRVYCPNYFMLKPGCEPFLMERIPALKNIKESDAKIFGIKLWKPKLDADGNKIYNRQSYYQPEISANFAKEFVYHSTDKTCMVCKRCLLK